MSDLNAINEEKPNQARQASLARRLDAAGWGLFFIWMGIATLIDVGWGIGLCGVALITLGMQAVRKNAGLKLEPFWIVVGLLFLLGGAWELAALEISLTPFLLIIAGIALLISTIRGKSGVK